MAEALAAWSDESAVSVLQCKLEVHGKCVFFLLLLWTRQLTDDDVCFGSSLLDGIDVIESAVDKLDFRVLCLYDLGSCLVADEDLVLIVGMGSVDFVKGRATNVA